MKLLDLSNYSQTVFTEKKKETNTIVKPLDPKSIVSIVKRYLLRMHCKQIQSRDLDYTMFFGEHFTYFLSEVSLSINCTSTLTKLLLLFTTIVLVKYFKYVPFYTYFIENIMLKTK